MQKICTRNYKNCKKVLKTDKKVQNVQKFKQIVKKNSVKTVKINKKAFKSSNNR